MVRPGEPFLILAHFRLRAGQSQYQSNLKLGPSLSLDFERALQVKAKRFRLNRSRSRRSYIAGPYPLAASQNHDVMVAGSARVMI